jgi:hypothetical protein
MPLPEFRPEVALDSDFDRLILLAKEAEAYLNANFADVDEAALVAIKDRLNNEAFPLIGGKESVIFGPYRAFYPTPGDRNEISVVFADGIIGGKAHGFAIETASAFADFQDISDEERIIIDSIDATSPGPYRVCHILAHDSNKQLSHPIGVFHNDIYFAVSPVNSCSFVVPEARDTEIEDTLGAEAYRDLSRLDSDLKATLDEITSRVEGSADFLRTLRELSPMIEEVFNSATDETNTVVTRYLAETLRIGERGAVYTVDSLPGAMWGGEGDEVVIGKIEGPAPLDIKIIGLMPFSRIITAEDGSTDFDSSHTSLYVHAMTVLTPDGETLAFSVPLNELEF